ncbi:hypothetical protein PAHAL_8G013700 [Panicum hallii]|jgi:hypothetical protein|uniref:Uncharacterized protein n=1 Tax=Panicum hallii TaxID=206008 RepID=A0A2S3IC35_9POAL|nr:hypothetical protein PAHAL_8G013700 [Panicum hallii]
MEMTASLALSRRHGAAEAGEGSAKKVKTENAVVGYEAPPRAAAAQKKKTKKVMTAVSKDQVDFVLASKPILRSRPSSVVQPRQMSEERRRQSAWVDEVVRSTNEIVRKLQENYRQQLDTKGCVHIEVEVTDDES